MAAPVKAPRRSQPRTRATRALSVAPARRVHEFVQCRTLGHAWDEFNPDATEASRWDSFDRLTLRCTRCTMERFDWFDRAGNVEHRRYRPPKGYKMTRDETPSRAALRLMMHGHSTRGVA